MFPLPPQPQVQLAGPLQTKSQMPPQPQTLPQVQYPQLGMGMTPMGGPPAAPVAQQMAQYGRGNDSMLMHVTPSEVQGLQGLAQMKGGSLTTNPVTGLPEAGFLEDMLPTILGVAGSFFGIPPMLTAAVVGGGTGLATGSLEKGLMAGLGAFGGSSLGAGFGIGGASAGAGAAGAGAGAGAAGATPISNVIAANPALAPTATTALSPAAVPSLGANLGTGAIGGTTGATIGAGAGALPDAARTAALQSSAYPSIATNPLTSRLGSLGLPGAAAPAAAPTPAFLTDVLGPKMGQQVADFGTRFAGEASKNFAGTPQATTNIYKTGAAALGAAQPLMRAMEPRYAGPEAEDDGFNYEGPYLPTERRARFKPRGTENDSSEFSYFEDTNPYPGFVPAPRGFAKGGDVPAPEVRPGNLDIAPKETFPLPPMPEVRPGNLEIAPPNVVQPGMPFPPQPPIPPSRWNSSVPGRVTRPLGYGDEYNYGTGGGETSYTPPPPTTPTVPPPLIGGGGAGGGTMGGGGGTGGFSYTQADLDNFFRRFGGGPTQREVTDTLVGPFPSSGGGGSTPTPPVLPPPPVVEPYSPPVAPPVVIEPPRPVNPSGGGFDVADEVTDTLPPPPPTVVAPPVVPPADMAPKTQLPPVLPPMPPADEPYLPPPPVYPPVRPGLDGDADQEVMPLASELRSKDKKFAAGGAVPLDNGAFIIDARTVSELGNGSSSAGQELLARYGGMPIRGKGDGVSDSIPAKIDGRQPARVARDEVKFDPEAVRRFGGGDHALGVKRLHALMDKAHKARKGADRGEDTKLRKAMTR